LVTEGLSVGLSEPEADGVGDAEMDCEIEELPLTLADSINFGFDVCL